MTIMNLRANATYLSQSTITFRYPRMRWTMKMTKMNKALVSGSISRAAIR